MKLPTYGGFYQVIIFYAIVINEVSWFGVEVTSNVYYISNSVQTTEFSVKLLND